MALTAHKSNRRKNPAAEAEQGFEKFHGKPVDEVIDVEEKIKVHANLVGLGSLMGFKVRSLANGKDYSIEFPGSVLAANEKFKRAQLFIEGGDQRINLKKLGFSDAVCGKETAIVGQVWCIGYTTEKSFDDFKPTDYVHTFGPEKAQRETRGDLWDNAQPPKDWAFAGDDLPLLRYDIRNERAYLDGGSFSIDDPFFGTSAGVTG